MEEALQVLPQITINILISFALYLLLSTSVALSYFTTKSLNIAHAIYITFGAYGVIIFYNLFHIPLTISFLLTTAIVIALSIAIYYYFFFKIKDKGSYTHASMVLSLGLYAILQNVISLTFGDSLQVIHPPFVNDSHTFAGGYITDLQLYILVLSLIVYAIIYYFIHNTKHGVLLQALASDSRLCKIYGINDKVYYFLSIGISSFIASMVGLFYGMDTQIKPTMGFNLFLYGVVIMILGGVGSYKGLVWASLLVAATQHILSLTIGARWNSAILYLLLIVILISMPYGISGIKQKKYFV